MKKLFFILMTAIPFLAKAQDEKQYSITISGHVSYEMIFDSRQTVNARDGDVLLYPKPILKDLAGHDINARPSFNMFAIHSRLRTRISGPQILGAESSALVEADFVGITDTDRSSLRLRHAMIKLDWPKSSLLMGEFWHPLFVLNSYPTISGWGGGVPYAVLSRNPQIRYTYHFSDRFYASIAAVNQSTFPSPGPDGASPEYLKNAALPEFDVDLQYKNKGWILGAVLGYKTLRPRLQDENGQATDETLASGFSSIYVRKDWGNFTAKIKGIYGQNLHNFVMLGGYAAFQANNSTKWEYVNYETGSLWAEFIYKHEQFHYAIFAGYAQNFGLERETFEGLSLVENYARGTNLAYTYRISPRIGYKLHDFLIMCEISQDIAAYGEPEINGDVINTSEVSNTRIQLHFKYNF